MRSLPAFSSFVIIAIPVAAVLSCSSESDSGCPSGFELHADGYCHCPMGTLLGADSRCHPSSAQTATGGATGIGGTSPVGGSAAGGTSLSVSSGGSASPTGGSTGSTPPTATPVTENCPDSGMGSGKYDVDYASSVIRTAGSSKQYCIQTNWWGLNGQTPPSVSWRGLSFKLDEQPADANGNTPIGYPSIFIGTYAGTTTAESNLPKRVGDLTSVRTALLTNVTQSMSANLNVAYDVWFTPTSAPLDSGASAPPRDGAYLMVWFFDPSGRQPRGNKDHPGVTVPNVDGSWDVWIDESNPPCISYVSTSFRDSMDFDLNDFIRHSVDNNYGLTNDQYLSIIFGGTEVWNGGSGLNITGFCAIVE